MKESTSKPQKRLFLALILVSALTVLMLGYVIWKLMKPGLSNVHFYLPYFMAFVIALLVLVIFVSVSGIALAIIGVKNIPIICRTAWYVVMLMYPVAMVLGRMFNMRKEVIERSFIEVSNSLMRQRSLKVKPEKLLVLTPQCIQWDECQYKITKDVNNCKGCGKCQVADLLSLSQKYGFRLTVATGGTLARKVIMELRPHAVLAIACERDLTSGIQDVFPMPVIGVLNERPFGPCCNTRIDLAEVEKTIKEIII